MIKTVMEGTILILILSLFFSYRMLQNQMDCTSHRLFQKVIKTYGKGKNDLTGEEKLYLNTGLHLNQEVLLLQV